MTKKYIQDFKSKLATGGTVSPEELQDFFSRLEGDLKDKKYGLVWESQTEQVIGQLKTNKVYLEEEQDLKITQDPDNPKSNILIEGDNYEALTYLNEINQKVDVIYIDPPYNTGNKDFVYNDRFIDKEDGFRHSQWLSFMDARLRLARELLTDDGVIFISIDDNEQAQLKLLCDQIFGEQQFVGVYIQNKGNAQNDALNIQKNHEYVLVYCKIQKNRVLISQEKVDVKEVFYDDKYSQYYYIGSGLVMGGSSSAGTLNGRPNLGYTYYVNPDTLDFEVLQDVNIELARVCNDASVVYNDNKELISKGYIPVRPTQNGHKLGRWKWSITKVLENKECIEIKRTKQGFSIYSRHIVNPEDVVKKGNKLFTNLHKVTNTKSILEYSSAQGTTYLKEIITNSRFSNAKNTEMIKFLIENTSKKDAKVLDFFAGSGTTGNAVLELNQEDGGSRQFILVTNNENNIARDVTYERNKRVIEGYTTPKGKDVPGIPSNLAYYKTKQVSKYDIDFDEVVLQHIIPTIQLTEGVYHRIRHSEHILQLGENIFIFNQYMVEDDEIDTLVDLVKGGDTLYIQEGQVDYIKSKLPEGVVYKYLEGILPTNR